MIDLIAGALKGTHERYSKILDAYYPAHGSTGFTERNLTHNFVISLRDYLGECSISWFEAPINIGSRKHIDAVVFDPQRNAMFIVESKRFSNPGHAIDSVQSDIDRITDPAHISLLGKGLKVPSIEKRYGIILTDVWLENDKKTDIFRKWPECVIDENKTAYSGKMKLDNLKTKSEWKCHCAY